MPKWLVHGLVGAAVISIVWAALLFKNSMTFNLNPYDVVMTLITFGSVTLNIVQWRESKSLLAPLRNPLIALFNELKARQLRVWAKQGKIHQGSTPVEFHDFTEETLQSFEQLREHVLSLIETVAPGLPDDDFFRAQFRGLRPEEKEMRELWVAQRKRQESKRFATEWEPAKSISRSYEGKRQATIWRSFTSGFEWVVEDMDPKAVIADGAAETLAEAQAAADAAAETKPTTPWKSSRY